MVLGMEMVRAWLLCRIRADGCGLYRLPWNSIAIGIIRRGTTVMVNTDKPDAQRLTNEASRTTTTTTTTTVTAIPHLEI